MEKNGLSCAKAGYRHRQAKNMAEATRFYTLGCELKDESSCNNVRNFSEDDMYMGRFNTMIKFHENAIRKCHVSPDASKITSNMQMEEKWYMANFDFDINKEGRATRVGAGGNLSKEFVGCAREMLMKLNYPKPHVDLMKISYQLTVNFYEKR